MRGPISEPYDAGTDVLLGASVEWATGAGLEAPLWTGARLIAPIATAANNGAMYLIVFIMVVPLLVRSLCSVIPIIEASRTGAVGADNNNLASHC